MTDRIDTPTCNCFPGDGQPHLMACPEYWREAEKVWADLEAEVQRLRGELTEARKRTKEAEGDMVMQTVRRDQAESNLASLRASHQEVTRIVREWQEARKAKLDLEDDPAGTHSRTVIERAVEREAEARFALAAIDLGGAE